MITHQSYGKHPGSRESAPRGKTASTAPSAVKSCNASTRASGNATQPAVPVVGERQTWMKMHDPAFLRASVG